ncbi:MAG: aldehyde ferredoxin oxidoreductase, partial [Candidatus Bathyarchaeota archaeon]|nr:aldehyde ferredoxin oxidoreductase [Candidatus Bathyarchaeota archaeon]
MFGWAGKNLRVDLSKRKVVKEPLNKELVHRFIGGRGINSKTLFDELEPGINPYSPDNKLIFGTGPLAGTFAPASARWTVTTKSPLTGILGDAHAGGHWAAELKFAGYDHIVLQGKAKKPVYLSIDDCDIELRDASEIWGEDTWKTQRFIKEDLGDPNIQVVCIGPAGERLVRFACIIHSLKRAAGRTGMGAVMGSKNLK